MKKRLTLALLLPALTGLAQATLTNDGATLTVSNGATLYVAGGVQNNTTGTLTTAGTVRVDGALTNAGTLDLSTGELEVRGDLTNTGTLTPGTGRVTFSGAADQRLTPGGATLYQVLVNKPTAGANTLRLTGDLTISHLLRLTSGLVTTASGGSVHTLRLPHGATLANDGAGHYVLGRLEITRDAVSGAPVDFGHGAVLDPASNHLGTVVITRRAGLLTAESAAAPEGSFGQNLTNGALRGIDRIWTVAPATQPSAPVQLTLSWPADNDHGISDFSQARVWQQPAAGQPWAAVGAATDARTRRLTAAPTVLNRFTVSNAANPLPVALLAFTAQLEGPRAARLRWATATEQHNAGFTVERSLDGRAFRDIGTVAGAGTSATRQDYTLLDGRLPAGATLLYYRLRQADWDGTLNFSPVRTVALSPLAAGFVVYPTKAAIGQEATYLYTGPAGPATLLVTDMLGRAVSQVAADGRAQGAVPLRGLASGGYLVRYTTATGSFTARLVVE
ncbi:T9SS type A sorting domain-containing protein [Hymenobacter sp. BT683]|uniref:T9SS type A sorting domain-containing protein n=1 Tax=Hymenobacter jeongseonensis TaxID=2791027 RepID=A0ABS0IPZ6_9BACT|nr:T9SS type A sorting domain-containing protein [Hymenobacter jeongseonensis]MBF9240008.1 T9SS type A sorting domain-containing protein [Hymenobacter jeongseonensis]